MGMLAFLVASPFVTVSTLLLMISPLPVLVPPALVAGRRPIVVPVAGRRPPAVITGAGGLSVIFITGVSALWGSARAPVILAAATRVPRETATNYHMAIAVGRKPRKPRKPLFLNSN
jgi:hypothetical protein